MPVPLRRIAFILLVVPMMILFFPSLAIGAIAGYLIKGTGSMEAGSDWFADRCWHNVETCVYLDRSCKCGIRSVYDWAHNPIEKPKTADKIAAIEADLKAIDREIEAAR